MADIEELKITSAQTNGKKVADLPDSPSENGMSAQELKEQFDALPQVVIEAFNNLIEYLKTTGAEGIAVENNGEAIPLQTMIDTIFCFADESAKYIRINENGRLEASSDNTTWKVIGTGEAMTPEEIGAARAEHSHTPEEIGAARAEHSHTPEEIGARPNKNLLHNWYFGNPVNRNGLTEYQNTGGFMQSVDRMKLGVGTVTILDGYINYNSTKKTTYKRIMQKVNGEWRVGETYTLSALCRVNDVSGIVWLRPATDVYSALSTNDHLVIEKTEDFSLIQLTFTLNQDLNNCHVEFLCQNAETDFIDVDIKAWKLERGDKQTLAHQDAGGNWVLNEIPDYAEQMAICEQYNPSTDAYIGQSLPINGSVAMSGNLKIHQNDFPNIGFFCNALNSYARIIAGNHNIQIQTQNVQGDESNFRSLTVVNSNLQKLSNAIQLKDVADSTNAYYNIFGEHNKPSGSYTGNGSSTTRTIELGSIGTLLAIQSDNCNAIVGTHGAIYWSGNSGYTSNSSIRFQSNGTLAISTSSSYFNESGVTYYYQVL